MKKLLTQSLLGLSLLCLLSFPSCDYLEFLEFEVPSTAAAGDIISISYKLKNTSQTRTTYTNSGDSQWELAFYLSRDKYVSPDDHYLGKDFGNILSPGEMQQRSRPLIIPDEVYTGKYYMIAGTRPKNSSADGQHPNVTVSPIEINGQPNDGKDLTAINVFPTYEKDASFGPVSFYAGDAFKFYWTAYNSGLVGSNSFTVEYYLSRAATYNPATVTHLASRDIEGLNSQEKVEVEESFVLEDSLARDYYYIYIFVDALGQNDEFDEDNNIIRTKKFFVSSKRPDLTITSVEVPTTINPDESFVAETRIENIGNNNSGVFDIKYSLYLEDEIVDEISYELGNLVPDANFSFSPSLDFPIVENGFYQLNVELDATGEITELVENNNQFEVSMCIHPNLALIESNTEHSHLSQHSEYEKADQTQHIFTPSNTMTDSYLARSHFSVYPNPTTNILNYQFTVPQMEKAAVKLYDMTGRLLVSFNKVLASGDTRGSVSLEQLPAGTYLLHIQTKIGIFKEKVIVK